MPLDLTRPRDACGGPGHALGALHQDPEGSFCLSSVSRTVASPFPQVTVTRSKTMTCQWPHPSRRARLGALRNQTQASEPVLTTRRKPSSQRICQTPQLVEPPGQGHGPSRLRVQLSISSGNSAGIPAKLGRSNLRSRRARPRTLFFQAACFCWTRGDISVWTVESSGCGHDLTQPLSRRRATADPAPPAAKSSDHFTTYKQKQRSDISGFGLSAQFGRCGSGNFSDFGCQSGRVEV
eukprot:536918-Rhodomonas_salina.2